MNRDKKVLLSVALVLTLTYILLTHLPHLLNYPGPNSGAMKKQVLSSNLTWPQPTIWVSMAVCLSSNTRFHGKDRFPNLLAVKLSSQLWLTKLSTVFTNGLNAQCWKGPQTTLWECACITIFSHHKAHLTWGGYIMESWKTGSQIYGHGKRLLLATLWTSCGLWHQTCIQAKCWLYHSIFILSTEVHKMVHKTS